MTGDLDDPENGSADRAEAGDNWDMSIPAVSTANLSGPTDTTPKPLLGAKAPKPQPVLVPMQSINTCVVFGSTKLPAPRLKECKPETIVKQLTKPLFDGLPTPEQVGQGSTGDCYFCSAVAAIAKTNPKAIQDLIVDNADGTYTVKFKLKVGPVWLDFPITVDSEIWVNEQNGTAQYGLDPTGKTSWFPILEKAFVQLKSGDSYQDVSGGWAAEGFAAVLGVNTARFELFSSPMLSAAQLPTLDTVLLAAGNGKKAVVLNTADEPGISGLVGPHSYHVLEVKKDDSGTVWVKIRNPWGHQEPVDAKGGSKDGSNDGVFWLKSSELGGGFDSLEIAKS